MLSCIGDEFDVYQSRSLDHDLPIAFLLKLKSSPSDSPSSGVCNNIKYVDLTTKNASQVARLAGAWRGEQDYSVLTVISGRPWWKEGRLSTQMFHRKS